MSEKPLRFYAMDREMIQAALAKLEALGEHTPAVREVIALFRAVLGEVCA